MLYKDYIKRKTSNHVVRVDYVPPSLMNQVVNIYEDRENGFYINGFDNLYAETVKLLVENSSTATACSNILRAHLAGHGYKGYNDFQVNDRNNLSVFSLLEFSCLQTAIFGGFYLHVNKNINGEVVDITPLDYTRFRLGLKDDREYISKVLMRNDWRDSAAKYGPGLTYDDNTSVFPFYSSDPRVFAARMELYGSIEAYPGEIFFFNPDFSRIYPLAACNSERPSLRTEFNLGVGYNTESESGFQNTKLLAFKSSGAGVAYYPGAPEGNTNTTMDRVREMLAECLGADNRSNVIGLEMDGEDDKITDLIQLLDIEGEKDPNYVSYIEETCMNRIRKSYYNVPQTLLQPTETLFSTSGEAIKGLERYYDGQTAWLRTRIGDAVNRILKDFSGFESSLESIVPLSAGNTTIKSEDDN